MIKFLVGIDGGGTGTRALIVCFDGAFLGLGEAGPSALGQGIDSAWSTIELAIRRGFESAGLDIPSWSRCAVGAGLSGINNPRWREEFVVKDPGFAKLEVETDAFTTLLGAHVGKPGAVIAVGTGTVGEAMRVDGARVSVGGWGFPAGDEGSGAWLGLQAVHLAQCAMDDQCEAGLLARYIWEKCGSDRNSMQTWCATAGQFAFAQLAPAIFDAAPRDPAAAILLERAAAALDAMALALDPVGELPLALCGSVGKKLQGRLSASIRRRCVPAQQEPTMGALMLIKNSLGLTI